MAEDENSNLALPSKDKMLMTCAIIGMGLICALVIIAALAIVGYLTGNNFGGGEGNLSSCTASQLPQSSLDQIEKNKSVYLAAADRAGVPWDFLAAIHYRETTLSTTDPNPFQIQNNKNTGFSTESATEAANKAKALVASVYGRNLTQSADEETLKLAFLSYNRGAMYKESGCTWNQSPYVMNEFDDAHRNMKWPDNECEPPATRGKTDGKLGAFTVLSILRGCAVAGTTGGEGTCAWAGNIANDPKGANIVSVEVPVWKYEGSNQKTAGEMTVRVHSKCANSIKTIFSDIYNSPDKPPIDTGHTYCYQERDSDSRHNWGVACDISYQQNWCWNCYAKSTRGDCTTGNSIGEYWRPGDISPDKTYRGWSAGLDARSAPINGSIANVFKKHGWGRGIYRCFNDFMHFSVDGH